MIVCGYFKDNVSIYSCKSYDCMLTLKINFRYIPVSDIIVWWYLKIMFRYIPVLDMIVCWYLKIMFRYIPVLDMIVCWYVKIKFPYIPVTDIIVCWYLKIISCWIFGNELLRNICVLKPTLGMYMHVFWGSKNGKRPL